MIADPITPTSATLDKYDELRDRVSELRAWATNRLTVCGQQEKKTLQAVLKILDTPINQCDGCQAGRPLDRNGRHIMGDGPYPDLMACQKEKYR